MNPAASLNYLKPKGQGAEQVISSEGNRQHLVRELGKSGAGSLRGMGSGTFRRRSAELERPSLADPPEVAVEGEESVHKSSDERMECQEGVR